MTQTSTIISGIVYDPDEHPVAQARVYFKSGPEPLPDIAALTNDDGEFSLSAPCSGTYQIGIAADDFSPISVMATATDGQEVTLKIQLKK